MARLLLGGIQSLEWKQQKLGPCGWRPEFSMEAVMRTTTVTRQGKAGGMSDTRADLAYLKSLAWTVPGKINPKW